MPGLLINKRLNPLVGAVGARAPQLPFKFNPTFETNLVWWTITGQTLDATSAPLGGCTVTLFQTAGDIELSKQISDGSGNYLFNIQAMNSGTFYVVAYLPGSPDVAGTTVNTLVGA